MGTRSTVKFISKTKHEKLIHEYNYTPLVNIYQQFDGYIEGVGHDLAQFLLDRTIINGIGFKQDDMNKYANGFGCLVAEYIATHKERVGGLYITDMDDVEEYNYEVYFDEDALYDYPNASIDDLVTIKVDSCPNFEGTPSELLKFEESDE